MFDRQLSDLSVELFDFGLVVFDLLCLVGKYSRQAVNRLLFPCRHLRWVDFLGLAAISCAVLSPSSASRATVALNLSEKLRLVVISVSRRQCWIHLSTLSEFAGPLQTTRPHNCMNGSKKLC